MSAVWVIRAGQKGEEQWFALLYNFIVIGWGWLGDLRGYGDVERVKDVIRKHADYAGSSEQRVIADSAQVWRFYTEVAESDYVLLPLKKRGEPTDFCALGTVAGGYQYDKTEDNDQRQHRYPVVWKNRKFSNARIPHPLGNRQTVSRIDRNIAGVIRILEQEQTDGERQV